MAQMPPRTDSLTYYILTWVYLQEDNRMAAVLHHDNSYIKFHKVI
jgi:hypothetical protein